MCTGLSWYSLMLNLRVWCIAISSALNIFCNPDSLLDILKFFVELYMPYDAVFAIQLSSLSFIGEKKDPSV